MYICLEIHMSSYLAKSDSVISRILAYSHMVCKSFCMRERHIFMLLLFCMPPFQVCRTIPGYLRIAFADPAPDRG